MMPNFLLLLCSLLFACSTPSSSSGLVLKKDALQEEKPTADSLGIQIQVHIQSYADQGEFSGAILVAKQGNVLFKGAFGFADYAREIPNQVDTRFLIGSTTKSFTAILLLRMVEKGLLDLQVPVSTYLPGLKPTLAEKLTLDRLMRMQSGLPNHLARLTKIGEKSLSREQLLTLINQAELAYEPGSRYSYSNLNYHLLGLILEKVSGMSYARLLHQEILDPLGMDNSGTDQFDTLRSRRATGHHVSTLQPADWNNLSYALGSGNIYATVEDLYLWDQALYDDAFLSQASKAQAFRGGTEAFGYYGYGFRIREYKRSDAPAPTGKLVRHGGTMQGYLANVHRYLDDRVTVIVLGNISMFPIRNLTAELADLALGKSLSE